MLESILIAPDNRFLTRSTYDFSLYGGQTPPALNFSAALAARPKRLLVPGTMALFPPGSRFTLSPEGASAPIIAKCRIDARLYNTIGLLDRATAPLIEDMSDAAVIGSAWRAMVSESQMARPQLAMRAVIDTLMKTCILAMLRRFVALRASACASSARWPTRGWARRLRKSSTTQAPSTASTALRIAPGSPARPSRASSPVSSAPRRWSSWQRPGFTMPPRCCGPAACRSSRSRRRSASPAAVTFRARFAMPMAWTLRRSDGRSRSLP